MKNVDIEDDQIVSSRLIVDAVEDDSHDPYELEEEPDDIEDPDDDIDDIDEDDEDWDWDDEDEEEDITLNSTTTDNSRIGNFFDGDGDYDDEDLEEVDYEYM